jgi:hypothetical protein
LAIPLAQRACELTSGKDMRILNLLEEAQAQAGQFEAAIATATKAREVALAQHDELTARLAEARIARYRQRLPLL